MHPAQTLDSLLEPLGGAARHRPDVAAGAEAASGTGDDDPTHGRIAAQTLKRFPQGCQHGRGKRVQPIGSVEGQPGDTIFCGFQEIGHLAPIATAVTLILPDRLPPHTRVAF